MAKKELEKLALKNKQDKYEIGNRIRDRRIALGLSQDELANRLGIGSRDIISRYENGTREMKISAFCQYVEALESNPVDLLPARLTGKASDTYTELMETIAGLPDNDLEILLSMAKIMKSALVR